MFFAGPYDVAVLVPQFLSLAGFFWTLKYFSAGEFLGLNQVVRWYHNEYNPDQLDEDGDGLGDACTTYHCVSSSSELL